MGYLSAESSLDRGRVVSILAVAFIHALLAFALLSGLGVQLPHAVADRLTLLNVTPPPAPPPKRIAPKHRIAPRKEGASAPPNLRAKATEVVAPKPIVPPIQPPPIPAAPIAGLGAAASAGAAPVPGPGTGSGGIGNGTGSGGSGDGDGGGGGGTPLRLKSGRIKPSDYPKDALRAGVSGTVGLLFTVGVNGRVTQCTVTRSSGSRSLDDTTCRLIQDRFRYKPTTNAAGRPIPDQVEGEHVWTLYRQDSPDDDDPR